MASPFKTHETMDLARALLEEDSNTYTSCLGSKRINNNEDIDPPKPLPDRRYPLDPNEFDNFVVSKDSSTELIPTNLAEESGVDSNSNSTSGGKLIFNNYHNNNNNNNKPALMLVRDLNAGKGMLDDDGKPAVGKVFSRVIQISGAESKPKLKKSHHNRGRSTGSCCRDRHGGGGGPQSHGHHHDKERSSSARPQSGQVGGSTARQQQCPRCERQFSDETAMDNHIVFCSGSSKEIM